jgi:branched-chain amino acid transport system permease protein
VFDQEQAMIMENPEPLTPLKKKRTKYLYLVPILALGVPLVTNEYTQYVVNMMLVYILVGVGLNIVVGNLGQLAFASAALFGIGAYTTGLLMAHLGVPFWIALLPGGLAGMVAGGLSCIPALRGVRRYYLAIITMAFGELMRWIYIHADRLTMGSTGLPVPTATLFGYPLATDKSMFYVFLVITTLAVMGTSALLKSRIGRAVVAIRENEYAAASLSIPTSKFIVFAFLWSGFVVGIAGSMFAVLLGRVVPESFGLGEVLRHFAIIIIGGLGSLMGSVIGAITLTAAPEIFRGFPGLEEVSFAVMLIVVLLVLPGGLASIAQRYIPALRERLYRD